MEKPCDNPHMAVDAHHLVLFLNSEDRGEAHEQSTVDDGDSKWRAYHCQLEKWSQLLSAPIPDVVT